MSGASIEDEDLSTNSLLEHYDDPEFDVEDPMIRWMPTRK